MELQLIRSFLEVAESGSFAAASDRLFVTQSAVSLRIQRLEEQLGKALFSRSTDGVTLTPAGHEFRIYAETIIRNWEMARQRLAKSADAAARLTIAAPPALWPGLAAAWLPALREALPELQIQTLAALDDMLVQGLAAGSSDLALAFSPPQRAGLAGEIVFEDQLLLLSTTRDPGPEALAASYIRLEAGEGFARFHDQAFPQLRQPGLRLDAAVLSPAFLLAHGGAAFLPLREASAAIAAGEMHPLVDAPVFTRPCWLIWPESADEKIRNVALTTLRALAGA